MTVTLSVRVWIEINPLRLPSLTDMVTLSVRVWIEIEKRKFVQRPRGVTLSVRVWIEIVSARCTGRLSSCHPQCEGVD